MRKRTRIYITAVAIAAAALVPNVGSSADKSDSDQLAERRDAIAAKARNGNDDTVLTTANAAQTSGCTNDTTGDTRRSDNLAIESYPKADITKSCVIYGSPSIQLGGQVVQFSNPNTDDNWFGITGWLWSIDLNGDEVEDYDVFLMLGSGGVLTTEVVDSDTGSTVCFGDAIASSPDYIAMFDASCIGEPSEFTVQGFFAYDSQWDDPNAPVYGDLAPATSFAGPYERPSDTGGGGDPAPAPDPDSDRDEPTAGRLAGDDRYGTAVDISRFQWPDGADTVFLARADNFPDALAGGTLTDGPVLLVPQCDNIPAIVQEEIARLRPTEVIALGGKVAICDQVLDDALSVAISAS